MAKNLKKTLNKGTKKIPENNFSIGDKLGKAIEAETIKKTGSRLLTGEKLKSFFGGVIGKGFDAVDKWLNGDKKGAVLAFASGVVPLLWNMGMPWASLGVAVASVVAAVMLKKMEEKENNLLPYGGVQCDR